MGDPGTLPQKSFASSMSSTYMPAENVPHIRTLTAFPNISGANDDENSLKAARKEVTSIANAIAKYEPVWLYAMPSSAAEARGMVDEGVTVKEGNVDNLWIRDLGPVFVRGPGSTTTDGAVDFNFNYWGGKARETVDSQFAQEILAKDFKGVTRRQASIVSEGGALEVDGEGTLILTDSSIINDNRNPEKTKEHIEAELSRLLGVEKIIWLKGVKGLESTDWHVDAFARFASPGHVVLSKPPPNAHADILDIYEDALKTFANTTDAKGRKIEVTIILEPDQEKLPGAVDGMVTSYANYLLVNGGIIMARFGQEKEDTDALKTMQSIFPDRKITQVYINELPRLGGGIHCATQQIPA